MKEIDIVADFETPLLQLLLQYLFEFRATVAQLWVGDVWIYAKSWLLLILRSILHLYFYFYSCRTTNLCAQCARFHPSHPQIELDSYPDVEQEKQGLDSAAQNLRVVTVGAANEVFAHYRCSTGKRDRVPSLNLRCLWQS